MKTYHAHIYFDSQDTQTVADLHFAATHLDSDIFKFHKLYTNKVGPHFLPMIELHFIETHKTEVIEWINSRRKGLSVLIHEDTGNDVEDHLEPIWLGSRLPIDFTFFAKVQQNPSLSVH
jgi:aromatic ring-cleaving dioxygenase